MGIRVVVFLGVVVHDDDGAVRDIDLILRGRVLVEGRRQKKRVRES